jgi:hypothetical protein
MSKLFKNKKINSIRTIICAIGAFIINQSMSNRFSPLLLTLAIFCSTIWACVKPSAKPVYIHIDKFSFSCDPSTEGSPTAKITDAWVYINEQAVGVYQIPCTIPIIADGKTQVLISPGIMRNGIPDKRAAYDNYASYIDTITLTPLDTIKIHPSSHYISGLKFNWMEDFEKGCSLSNYGGDTSIVRVNSADTAYVISGTTSGVVKLTDAKPRMIIKTNTPLVVPTDGSPLYMEMDYKNDIPITISFIADVNGVAVSHDYVTLNAKRYWNKIYIDFTEPFASLKGSNYQIVFKATKSVDGSSAYIRLDNIKFITR